MPGLVTIFTWSKTSWGSLELLHKQNLAIYDAQPGPVWDGIGGLLAKISKEYNAIGIWTAKPDRNASPPEPPNVKVSDPASSGVNLLHQVPTKIVFPERGTLLLVVFVGNAPRPSEEPLIGDATEWCALYDARHP